MLSEPKGSLETQRSAWKERHDSEIEHAKFNSGKTFEDLKRAEAWFDAVAWAESFPIERPKYPSDTYFLEQENRRLRDLISDKYAQARRDAEKATTLRKLIESYDRQVTRWQSLGNKPEQARYEDMIRETTAELRTLEQAEARFISMQKYDPNSKTQFAGNVKKLWKENQELEQLQKGVEKRLRVNCMVCKAVEAAYIWDKKYLVCSQRCANHISSS